MTKTALLSLVQGWVRLDAPVLKMKRDVATLHTHLDGAILFAVTLHLSRFVLMKRETPFVHLMATARKQGMQISGLKRTHKMTRSVRSDQGYFK